MLDWFPYLPQSALFNPTAGGRVHQRLVPTTQGNTTEIPAVGDGPQLQALRNRLMSHLGSIHS
eukprot:622962-Rhodomonas_salina.1